MTVATARRRPLIVVEPLHQGHRMMYFAALAEHLLARGVGVTLATSRAGLESPDLALRLGGAGARIGRIDIGPAETLSGTAFVARVVRVVVDLQARHPDSDVLVTEGDKFLPAALAAAGRIDWRRLRVLVMRAPRPRRRVRALVQDAVKVASMELATRLGADVRVLEQATPVRTSYRRGRWRSVPDPVDVADLAELTRVPPELGGVADDRRWLGVLGHVSPRKNLDLVLEAARFAGADGFGVLVAGRVEPGEWERCADTVAAFDAAGGRLLVVDRLLADTELDACVAWVDAVVVAHSSEGPSGILGKAVALGTPVVAAGAQSLRDEVERLGSGTWAPLRAPDIAAALHPGAPTERRPVALAGSADFARALLEG